jgi:PIN domain nuclease of toxin-antitoxin system
VNILVDTQIVLWVLENNPKLPDGARNLLSNQSHRFFVSSISIWELVIKNAIGKLPLPVSVADLVRNIDQSGFIRLEFHHDHAAHVASLPSIHHDPFDRALLAQASLEPMHLLTHDQALTGYGAMVMFVRNEQT